MLKVVLDTNIVISGIFFGGIPFKILECLDNGLFKLILSEEIISEYIEIIKELEIKSKKNTPFIEPNRALELIISKAEIIEIGEVLTPHCDDPDDIKFLEVAIAAKAKYLVSGDKHLLDVVRYSTGMILKPKDFLGLIYK